MMTRVAVTDSNTGLVPNAPTFQIVGAGADFTEWLGEIPSFVSDGAIRISDGPLLNARGSTRDALVDALLRNYRAKGEESLRDLAGASVWSSGIQQNKSSLLRWILLLHDPCIIQRLQVSFGWGPAFRTYVRQGESPEK